MVLRNSYGIPRTEGVNRNQAKRQGKWVCTVQSRMLVQLKGKNRCWHLRNRVDNLADSCAKLCQGSQDGIFGVAGHFSVWLSKGKKWTCSSPLEWWSVGMLDGDFLQRGKCSRSGSQRQVSLQGHIWPYVGGSADCLCIISRVCHLSL